MPQNVFVIHFFTAVFMTGLIWTIQLVHYPSFHYVEESQFIPFEAFHSFRISFIVLPVMLVELFSAAVIIYLLPTFRIWAIGNFLLLASIWLITFFISAKLHGELMHGYNQAKVDWLVTSNWFRTSLWTLRSVGLCFLIKSVLTS